MSLFRSQEMGLYLLSIEKNYTWEVIHMLGQHSVLHFIDANEGEKSYNRSYTDLLRRCDEAQKRIRLLESLCVQHRVGPLREPADVNKFLSSLQNDIAAKGKNSMEYFEELEQFLIDTHNFLKTQKGQLEEAYEAYNGLVEKEIVYNTAWDMMWAKAYPGEDAGLDQAKILCLAGTIQKEDTIRFKRLIFRKSLGNAITFIEEASQNPDSAKLLKLVKKSNKYVYVVIFRGEHLKSRIIAACESFTKQVYADFCYIRLDSNKLNNSLTQHVDMK